MPMNYFADYNKCCSDVLDKHAPPTIKQRVEKHRPGWYGDSVDSARRERRRCERKWRKTGSPLHFDEYTAAKQVVKDTVTKSKIVYHKDRLANSSVKDMYRTVNELLNKDSNPLPDNESPSNLANEFGQFFVGKVQKIRSEIDKLGDNCNRILIFVI